MKTFNYYKNKIEQDCESLRINSFEIIELFDLTSFDEITESLHRNKKNITKKTFTSDEFSICYSYEGTIYSFHYVFETEEATFSTTEEPKFQVSFNARTKLLNYISSNNGKLILLNKPNIYSNDIKDIILKSFSKEYESFDQIIIYEPKIDIDNVITVNALLFDYSLNIGLDVKGSIENDILKIKRLNIFNISKIDKSKIEIHTEQLSWQDNIRLSNNIKIIFEEVFINYVEDTTITELINQKGVKMLKEENLREMIELRVSL